MIVKPAARDRVFDVQAIPESNSRPEANRIRCFFILNVPFLCYKMRFLLSENERVYLKSAKNADVFHCFVCSDPVIDRLVIWQIMQSIGCLVCIQPYNLFA